MVWIEIALATLVGYLLGSISFTGIAIRYFTTEEQRATIQHPSTQIEDSDQEPIYGAYTTNRVWGAKVGIGLSSTLQNTIS